MSVQTHTLKNGFRILTENMPGLESTTIGVWVNAGARNETASQNGIAHFLEHMAFKGTKRRTSLEIVESIENVGGFLNAYTSRETTAYYARVLAQDVPLALDVLGDILRNSTFEAKEIEVERGVIIQEIGQSLDTPDDVVFDWLQEVAYPDQPMGRSILGPTELIKGFNRNDLSGFVAQNYGPENLILSAAGAVDHDALVKQAEALFGDMPRGTAPLAVASRFIGGERRVLKDLEQAHFTLAFESPDYSGNELFPAQVFALVLGGGMTSRLFQEIREKRGLCYSIFASSSPSVDTGMFSIYAGTSGDQLAELMTLTVDELRRAADDISEAEVERSRVQMKAGLLMGLESPSARAERMARAMTIWGKVPTLSETVEKIDAVNVANVREFGTSLCVSGKQAMALYGPIEVAPTLASLNETLLT
ncbi:MAG: insulinase family protein [Rhodobacteraceae bacterium]|nr:insulinase family protein [Paracoccaceae bacterium]